MHGALGIPAMGAVGAGWSSALVLTLTAVAMLVYVATRPRYRCYRLFARSERPASRELLPLLRLGLPIALVTVLEVGLPLAWSLGIGRALGPHGLWVGLVAGLTLAAVLLSIRFWRINRDAQKLDHPT